MYIPKPVNTEDVVLGSDIMKLSEELAKNTHEVWSAGRMADGWKYGEMRDDGKKLHPCLVEYESLSDEEKEYDRRTAIETLKLIVKLGYEITKNK